MPQRTRSSLASLANEKPDGEETDTARKSGNKESGLLHAPLEQRR
jgi:hypothetical protein